MSRMVASDVRLGHSLRGGAGAVEEVIRIVRGAAVITARSPEDAPAVGLAEQVLGVRPDARPVYAYVGDLHPALGTVGLIVNRTWCHASTGVTRCDSGGLAGRRGSFAMLDEREAVASLRDLSFGPAELRDWPSAFANEVAGSYVDAGAYVDGQEPDVSGWADVRARCIGAGSPPRDRRAWTWEVRLLEGPSPNEIVGLVLSPGAGVLFANLVEQDSPATFPNHVQVLVGNVDADGAHFHTPRVRAVLAGGV
jgi:hypothetical protein